MNITGLYQWMRKILRNMSDYELNYLVKDINDVEVIKRLHRATGEYLSQVKEVNENGAPKKSN